MINLWFNLLNRIGGATILTRWKTKCTEQKNSQTAVIYMTVPGRITLPHNIVKHPCSGQSYKCLTSSSSIYIATHSLENNIALWQDSVSKYFGFRPSEYSSKMPFVHTTHLQWYSSGRFPKPPTVHPVHPRPYSQKPIWHHYIPL